jgi:drug/metabolite transporter (DMT)-like permease
MAARVESVRDFFARFLLPLAVATALVAFAANSLLCRLALRPRVSSEQADRDGRRNAGTTPGAVATRAMDPGTFTVVRLWAGAGVLCALALVRRTGTPSLSSAFGGSWAAALALFVYAAAFSFAYTQLSTGTGALLLFGSVQVTMLLGARWRGEPFRATDGAAMALAGSGVAVLLAPGVSAPPLGSAALMVSAGVAWGVYSLLGRRLGGDPIAATTGNFARAAAPAAVLALLIVAVSSIGPQVTAERPVVAAFQWQAEPRGWFLAIVSGGLTSGLGYVVWYAALRQLAAKTAALLQLAVPWIAAAGGVAALGERPTLAMFIAGPLIAAGVWFAVRPKPAAMPPAQGR